jgi:hypothetical protein
MTHFTGAEREAQRVAHLVFERPRPKRLTAPARPAGMGKQEWKAERKRLLGSPVPLAPDIEKRVALRESYGGGKATPETNAHVASELTREGSLARLVRSRTLDLHQLAAAEEIRAAHAVVIADVAVRTARWERGLGGAARGSAAGESYAQVRRQLAYTEWREAVAPHAAMLLAIVVDDLALTSAARRWRMSDRRARTILTDALDRWRRG